MNIVDRNHFLDDSIHRDLNFDRNDDVSINLDDFGLLDNVGDNLFYLECSWHLLGLHNDSFANHLLDLGIFFIDLISDEHLPYHIYWLFHLNVDVSWHLNLNNSLLDDWNLDHPFYLDNLGDYLYFLHDLLHNLRDIHYFLDNSWHNHDLFDNLFNFDDFRHLDHLFDDFLDDSRHIPDSFNNPFDWNDFLFDNVNNLWLLYKVINDSIYLLDSILVDDFGFFNFNFFVDESFNDFDHWFFNIFLLNLDDFFD
jgi:hypothetical protein